MLLPKKSELYFAVPIDLYNTLVYYQVLTIAQTQFPGVRIIEPARKKWTTTTWLDAWPGILSNLSMLTVIPRCDRSVGWGCWVEITDVTDAGMPVWVFDHDNQSFYPLRMIRRVRSAIRSLPYYALVYSRDEIAETFVGGEATAHGQDH